MASKFQSRLVGTIVLVAVGVIILPDLLDGKKLHYKEEFASIPLKPEISAEVDSFEVLEPEEDTSVLPDSPVQATVGDETVATQEDTRDVVDVAVKPVPERNEYADSAWIIQLMALKNADNARALVADLQKRGYQAHVKQESTFTRVIIGPDVSKSKLEKQLVELEKITGSKGQLLKFKPLNP
ncbi:SPOR domain-containing protein [Vibrio hangzhouensis]|uniref:DedD protein n=1 Tax=Vibrio hangzhouensis TaxID=462991 RepID=A0A1H6A676_9VIBR|nr:SPOR domain-containing protein [Vibrio hangzhouensis]MBY6197792.1 SPOR domain-containing protein [Vibrio hangzhouensis]SEG43694.1 DedD protein [Vibrio hangzhouensis]